jgi:hypothetical protein
VSRNVAYLMQLVSESYKEHLGEQEECRAGTSVSAADIAVAKYFDFHQLFKRGTFLFVRALHFYFKIVWQQRTACIYDLVLNRSVQSRHLTVTWVIYSD